MRISRLVLVLFGMMPMVASILSPAVCPAAEPPTAAHLEFFESRIRPVLVEHCYECHNSGEAGEGGLAVDHRQALLAGGDNGVVIVPGKPDESRLLKILRHEVEGLEMPQGGAKLEDRVIADFEKWIAIGAPDPRDKPPSDDELAAATSWEAVLAKRKQWWSFQPIEDPDVPAIVDPQWAQHPVDCFIFARLLDEDITRGNRAEPRTLVRRAYFTLIGLPPTAEEAEHWQEIVADPDGFGQLVDTLLSRPEFGERWARHWMDWIRYAESHGSEGDPPIENAWHYRDYLIRALNADVPYDQLVREHVAGDLLEKPRINEELGINESRIGPAHWRMVFHGFAPTDALDEKVRFIDDQINSFSKAFLGLTVSCARCHDHKFDAISQRDYYALFGILGSCRPGRAAIDVEERLARNRQQLVELKPRIRLALAADWLTQSRNLEQKLPSGVDLEKAKQPDSLLHPWFLTMRDVERGLPFFDAWQKRADEWQSQVERRPGFAGADQVWHAELSDPEQYADWFGVGLGLADRPSTAGEFAVSAGGENAVTGIYPAGVYSHTLSTKHAARLSSPDMTLDGECDLWLRVIGDDGATVRYAVQDYPRSGTVYPVTALSPTWKWQKYDLSYWDGDSIHIELTTALDAPLLVKDKPRSWFGIGEAMLIHKGKPGPTTTPVELGPLFHATFLAPPESFEELATCYAAGISTAVEAWRDGACSDDQALFLDECLRQGLLDNRLESLPTAAPLIKEYRRLEDEIAVPTRVPGLEETVGQDQPLFHRGNHKQPTDEVSRRFLEAIDETPYDTQRSGRRQLAEDLLRDDNPLTRRVIVNRLWHHLFGAGLVATPDNFGSLGQTPSHPQLLDWLAKRFVEGGWSLKSAIRLMVTSNTWQLDSRPPPEAQEFDPENRLLSHANVRRLEAEAIRDAQLAVSGGLSDQMFGPPAAGSSNRRSIYVEVKRNTLDPFLRVFDFPEPFATVGRRSATNVPAQSLSMMNDELVAQRAAAWAERVLSDQSVSDEPQRIQQMFRAAFGRPAALTERSRISAYLSDTRRQHRRMADQLADLRGGINEQRTVIEQLTAPVRQRLLEAAESGNAELADSMPAPIAVWEFDGDLGDSIGEANGAALGGARVEDEALVVDGKQAYVLTEPLAQSLREKTLEAWVQLDNLNQRGGGVMTVQSRNGVIFDSIVFGEQGPKQWLAGSNNFRRTQPFGGPAENEATKRPVHIAIAYHGDGRIVGYRDGEPYGNAYQSNGPQEFEAGQTVVSFGVRHLPASGNRMLSGRIFRARLYDRALTGEEVAASSASGGFYITEAQLIAALSPAEREQVESARQQITELEAQIESLGPLPESLDERAVWSDLARALFSFKEFIYIK